MSAPTTTPVRPAVPETVTTMSVVITHYRTPEVLYRCLDRLMAVPSDRLADVVVVDGDPLDRLDEECTRRWPRVRYVAVPANVGFGGLVNIGVRSTRSSYVLVLNADVRIDAGCLEELCAHLDATPDCGLVAPQLRNDDGSLQDSTFAFHRPLTVLHRRTPLGQTRPGQNELERFLDRGRRDAAVAGGQPLDVDWVLGAAMGVRRSAIDEVGPMDSSYFLYFEDVDWCFRFWQAGWRVTYLPTARGDHSHGRASAQGGALAPLLNPLTRRHIRSAVRFFVKHGSHPIRVQHAGEHSAARQAVAS